MSKIFKLYVFFVFNGLNLVLLSRVGQWGNWLSALVVMVGTVATLAVTLLLLFVEKDEYNGMARTGTMFEMWQGDNNGKARRQAQKDVRLIAPAVRAVRVAHVGENDRTGVTRRDGRTSCNDSGEGEGGRVSSSVSAVQTPQTEDGQSARYEVRQVQTLLDESIWDF